VGIVVPALEPAMAHLTELVGLHWGPVIETQPTPMIQPGSGTRMSPSFRLSFSRDEPHLELIEEVPGTIWVCNEYSNLHHIGFWTTDLGSESSRLTTAGCPVEIAGLDPRQAVSTVIAYHRSPLGLRIEMVDLSAEEAMSALWSAPN
jgi:hypothetical protein